MGSLAHLNISDVTSRPTGQVDPVLIFGPQRDPMYIVLPITIMYSFIFLTGLFGNVFTCLVIIRNKSMHTATNYYLFSLAVSDLLLLVSGMPQEMYSIWSKWPYVFGPAFCLIRGLAAETSSNASVLTITLFTIERYLAICHPFVSHKMSKLSRATKHVVMLWVVSLALALPQALQFGVRSQEGVIMCLQIRVVIPHSFEISTFLFFFAPMALITILYSLIGLRLRKSGISKEVPGQKEVNRNMRFTPKVRRNQNQSTKRVVKMLVAVVAAFFICWAPFHAQRLVAIYGTNENHRPKSQLLLYTYIVLTYTSGVFYYFSTSINPILYHIMSNKFRDAFKNTLVRCCRPGDRTGQRCSYTTLALGRHPTSSGTNSGNNPKDGTPKGNGIKRDSKTSLSDKKITFEPDCNVNYFLRKQSQKNRSVVGDLERGIGKEAITSIENKEAKCLNRERDPIYVLPSDVRRDDGATKDNKDKLSDEPEVYIKEIEERIIRHQKVYG